MLPIYIYGSGGHGRVILDTLQMQNVPVAGFVDDAPDLNQTDLLNVSIWTAETLLSTLAPDDGAWVIAIGNNAIRETIAQKLKALGHSFASVIHPSAQIGSRVTIAPGAIVMANTTINCDSQIGSHTIVNTGAIIDHDCTIGDFCHIAPGTTLCGHVTVGANSWLQAGTTVAPCTHISENTVSSLGATLAQPS